MASDPNTNAGQESALLTGSLIITRPLYKHALLAFVVGSVCAIIWAFFGSIPHRIEGLGEVNTTGGLYKVSTSYKGQIDKINVRINDDVKEGQILFLLKQPELENTILEMERELALLQTKKTLLKSGNATSSELKSGVNKIAKESLLAQIIATEKTRSFLEKKLQQNEKLLDDGLITDSQLVDVHKSLSDVQANKAAQEKALKDLVLSTQEWEHDKDMSENDAQNQIENLSKKLSSVRNAYSLNTEVASPISGVIVQMNVKYGNQITAGMQLCTVEVPDNQNNYILDMYVPFNSNARLSNGMDVDIEPFAVDRNLYGWLKGKVVNVNDYVSDGVELANELANDDLAKLIAQKGPVYKVTIKLLTDHSTESGFAWSNKKGPPFSINLGSLCTAYVKVKDKAPIDFLIPIFKEYFE